MMRKFNFFLMCKFLNSSRKYVLLLLVVGLVNSTLFSQPRGLIQSKYYSVDEYNAGMQNWAVAQDKRGVMYFGNATGVLEFDGETWSTIRLNNRSTVRSLAVGANGEIFVGGYGEMGVLAPNKNGTMVYHSLMDRVDSSYLDFKEIWDINSFGDTIFFLSDNFIFKYSKGKFSYFKSHSRGFYLSFSVDNSYYVQELGVGLMKYTNGVFELVDGGRFFSDIFIHSIFPDKKGLLIATRKKGFFMLDTLSVPYRIQSIDAISSKAKKINEYFTTHSFYHGIAITNDIYAFSSISGDLLIVDRNWNVRDIIDSRTIGVKSPTLYLFSSDMHNLWLALDNGIALVEAMSPYRYWNETMGINGVLSDVAQVDNNMYVSTGSGIFYTKLNSKALELNAFTMVEGDFEQVWGFMYFQPPGSQKMIRTSTDEVNFIPDNSTILLAATRTGVYQISGGGAKKIAQYDGVNSLQQSKIQPDRLYLGTHKGIAELVYNRSGWKDNGLRFLVNELVTQLGEDSLGCLWVKVRQKGLFRVKNLYSNGSVPVVEHFDTSSALPRTMYLQILDIYNPVIFETDSNYYWYVDSLNRFEVFEVPETVYTEEQEMAIKLDSLTRNRNRVDELTLNYVIYHRDSLLWFSTKKGVFCRKKSPSRNLYRLPPVLIRKVISGDSLVFGGANYSIIDTAYAVDTNAIIDFNVILKYKNNSITFFYAWPYFEGDTKKLYSYLLLGYDRQWSNWTIETKKDYTNLPEGNYTFMVKGKNIYGIESPVAEYRFSILPPWYRTIYAYFGYMFGAILVIVLIVKFYTYRLILEKNKLEQTVRERTQEILIQNEEILVQAEHLKDANDWIMAKNVELETQKKELEKKKDELEISDATKNKFFRIIAHDLRNPISTMVNTTSYILADIEEFDKDRTKRIVGELNRVSITTYNFLENLLDWATNQMGDLKFKPRSLNLLFVVNENIELVRGKIDSKMIHLAVDISESIEVYADENMLNTVIRNIIANAVKFTNDEGVIKISAETDEDYCYLKIADNGVGISPQNITKLFKIDEDVVTIGTHNEKGSGLGLILSKEFIERNGGSISVESELGKGSAFTISLTLA